jgi:hypothetical protein
VRVKLHLDWSRVDNAASPLQRRDLGFQIIRERVAAGHDGDIPLHAFIYAFLRRAKNVDLYVGTDYEPGVRDRLDRLRAGIAALEAFERYGHRLQGAHAAVKDPYLALRRTFAEPSARDERRVAIHYLMNGPGSDRELAADLGLSETFAARSRRALADVITGPDDDHRFGVADSALPIVLFLARETTGINPLAMLD